MEFGVGGADFLHWHEEEMAFLSAAKQKEPDDVMLKVSYVEAMKRFLPLSMLFLFTSPHDLIYCAGINTTK